MPGVDAWNEIKEALIKTERKGIEDLIKFLEESDFRTCPASTRFHNNFKGGLLDHTYNVWRCAELLARCLPGPVDLNTFLIGAVCHDLSKIGTYQEVERWRKDKNNQWERYLVWDSKDNEDPSQLLGHATGSVDIASRFIELTPIEKVMIVNHMGAIGVGYIQQQEVGEAFKKCPEAAILHLADMQATYCLEKTVTP